VVGDRAGWLYDRITNTAASVDPPRDDDGPAQRDASRAPGVAALEARQTGLDPGLERLRVDLRSDRSLDRGSNGRRLRNRSRRL
jgi:hypothetical protein